MQHNVAQPSNRDFLGTPIDALIRRDTDNTLQVTIQDADGVAIDITNDTVTMTVSDKPGGTQKIQKINLTGQHTVPASGTTRFDFTDAELEPAGTDAEHTLYWWYEVRRTTAGGDEFVHIEGAFTILPSGRELVFTYRGDPGNRILDAIRLEVGDTDAQSSEVMTDSELTYYASRYGISDVETAPTDDDESAITEAAAAAAEALVGKFAKEASYGAGGMSEASNQKSAEVRRRARMLRKRAHAGAAPYAGGQSIALKEAKRTDTNLPQSSFHRGMMENDSNRTRN